MLAYIYIMLTGKKILVGITGGIAAYKTPLLIRLLIKNGAEVKVAATKSALQFVTPTTLETLSKNKIYTDLFAETNEYNTEHVALKDWADFMIVAPATANCIGKLASGIADDALSTLLLAFNKPLFICPAMNTNMLENFSVQRNIQWLKDNGIRFVEPASGQLACGVEGKGRMEEPENILDNVIASISQNNAFAGKRVLITAGPTYEKIDAVRFIGNFSTGKMGYALAMEFAQQGAEVVLVSGPTHLEINHPNVKKISVMSAREMYEAANEYYPTSNVAILSAAVADFRPETAAEQKIKKTSNSQTMDLHLVQNPDILASLGSKKRDDQILVGFALETNDELANAKKKLEKKNLDFIVLNSLQDAGAGFGHDTNKVTFVFKTGKIEQEPLKSKKAVAADIAKRVRDML